MSSDIALLSDRSIKVLRNYDKDYLVEVFRPWNCYEKEWADSDTLQLRFETKDLRVDRDMSQELECSQWEVFTGFEGVYQGSTEGLTDDCVCWLVDDSLISEPGLFGCVADLTQDVLKTLDSQIAERYNRSAQTLRLF